MATWNVGPFDNDDAAEWCERLEATGSDQRTALVQSTLEAAVRAGVNLSPGGAAEALAAAATVLQALTGAQPSNSPYAPRFLLGRDDIDVSPALRDLAVRAIDSIGCEGSPWRERWVQDVEAEEAFALLAELRESIRLASN